MLGDRTNSFGGKANLHTVDVLDLQVDLELASGSDIGMAAGVTGSGTAAGHLTDSRHNRREITFKKDLMKACFCNSFMLS